MNAKSKSAFKLEQLKNSERLFEEAIEVAGAVPYYQNYLTNQYEYVQPGIRDLIGYEPDEFTPELWQEISQEIYMLGDLKGLTVEEAVEKSRGREGVSWRADYHVITKQGEERWIANAAVQVRDDDGQVIGSLGILQDITERKSLEMQLRQSQKMDAIGQLAGGIAHNINNLLTGILGNISLAQEKAPQAVQHYLHNVANAANRAAELVRELLAFCRKSPVNLNPLDLNSTINEVHQLLRDTFDRRIELILDLSDPLPYIHADSAQLSTVLMNLCINARDAIEKVLWGVEYPERQNDLFHITLKTEQRTIRQHEIQSGEHSLKPGEYVVVQILDNGCGMDLDTQNNIFVPFYTTKPSVGTGLGLASAFGIVKQHNGWIGFRSTPGEGTTFTIYLPALQEIAESGSCRSRPLKIPRGTETILLIDDEEIILNTGVEILKKFGYKVYTAAHGIEGLTQFRRYKEEIDLIILDLSMPQMSGIEFLKRLGSDQPAPKILISSGHPNGHEAQDFSGLGVVGSVTKPYNPEQLLSAVRKVLDTQ